MTPSCAPSCAPRQVIDGSKQLRWTWDNNDPFGNNAADVNPAGLGGFAFNLRFAGQYADSESGLFYNYFREYDPRLGRYIESDPIGLWGGLNTYTYVRNNPLKHIDPKGLNPLVGIIEGGEIGTLACGPYCGIAGAIIGGLSGLALSDYIYNNSSQEDNGQSVPIDLPEKIPDFDFNKPEQCPVDGNGNEWPWKGKPPQGGDQGGYKNPNGPESLHPDLDHGGDIEPHWDFNDRASNGYRIGADGTIWPK